VQDIKRHIYDLSKKKEKKMGKSLPGNTRLTIFNTFFNGAVAVVLIVLASIYIPRIGTISTQQRSFTDGLQTSIDELNHTALMLVSRLEALMMDTATNQTLIETGTCEILFHSSDLIDYELYSLTRHDGSTIYFIKFLPMVAPVSININNFGFQSCTGPLMLTGIYNTFTAFRLFQPSQFSSFTLSNPEEHQIAPQYSFNYGAYIVIDILGFTTYPISVQVTSPLIMQVPIEPIYTTIPQLK
jgi:hypothetical protein